MGILHEEVIPECRRAGRLQGLPASQVWKPSEVQAGDDHHPGWDGSCGIGVACSFACIGTEASRALPSLNMVADLQAGNKEVPV